jgi:hypothetical protein
MFMDVWGRYAPDMTAVMFMDVWGRYAPDMTAKWSQIGKVL